MFPENDTEFEENEVTKVQPCDNGGWTITCDLCFFVPPESPVEPKPGMIARFYGKGFGFRVRGLFLDEQKVFYRTEEEDKEQAEIQLYGADVEDLLKRWDDGDTVHSVEMGGLGPGYEQAIQIAMFEILRFSIDKKPDHTLWENPKEWSKWREKVYSLESLDKLGLSGAQAGAALSLASSLYIRGPRKCLKEIPKERKILVSNYWPKL